MTKKAKPLGPGILVSNNVIHGGNVVFDAKVVAAIDTVAQGLLANARELADLVGLFRAHNVTMGPGIVIEPDSVRVAGETRIGGAK